jgi:predicted transposase/invertase (TIGR01784 family)
MSKNGGKTKEVPEVPSVYMNPLTDFGFKKVFGDKELLIHFLNDILPETHIIDIKYEPTESSEWEARKAVYDLLCISDRDEYYLIEVQRARQTYFTDRALFYSSCMIRRQAPRGYWNFELKTVYVLSILDFTLTETREDKEKHVFEYISLMNERTKERFSEKLRFIYIQLNNFNRTPGELKTNADYWLYFLKNLSRLEGMPSAVRDRIFKRLFQIARIDKLNKEEMITYNKSILEYNDVADAVHYAKQRGIELGEQRGIKLGEQRGEQKKAIDFAGKLAARGMSLAEIAELTDISPDDLRKILKK